VRSRVADGEQERLVGHVAAQRLAVDLEGAAGVGAAVLAAELLQAPLQLLLPPPPHHSLRVRDGPREACLRQFCAHG